MAHQTFYIDIDEEITSVVERLKRARANEIILVVPKRALLIQSIVNLRILKKEADEARMQLMMVTQDKLGKILIEKAGIFVQQKMDNIADDEVEVSEDKEELLNEKYEEGEDERVVMGKNRLAKIGSESYFNEKQRGGNNQEEQLKREKEKLSIKKPIAEKEELINKELVSVIKNDADKKLPVRTLPNGASFDLTPTKAPEKMSIMKGDLITPISKNNSSIGKDVPISQDKKIEDFFYQLNDTKKEVKRSPLLASNPDKGYEAYNLPTKVHKWFWIFGVVATLAVAGSLAYLFIPKAMVNVTVKLDSKTVDSQVIARTADALNDKQEEFIPAKLVSTEQEVSGNYEATGSALVSNQKAHGTIIIYNDYDSSEHPLVATTRFLTTEGKLFRLVQAVTVPGMKNVNGKSISGMVEASVAADEAGESFNVDPTTFSIPGFQSSGVKYQKIYAKSEKAMTGGGASGSELKAITEKDMATAKAEIISKLDNKLKDALKESFGEKALILDGSLSKEDIIYKISNSAGDVANTFEITASTSAKALVINQNDLDEIIMEMLSNKADGKNIKAESIVTNFSPAEADFTSGTLNVKFHATGKISPDFNENDLKKVILGKSEGEIQSYLGDFPNIEKLEIEYWPSLVSGRIPFQKNRVSITLDLK